MADVLELYSTDNKLSFVGFVPLTTAPSTTDGTIYYNLTDNKFYFRQNGVWAEVGGGAGTVTSVAAGNGMNFTAITASGSVALGTPSTCTGATTNTASGTTHTHAVTGFEPTVSKGNLSAGSTKITIGGTGTGALIGAGASVDVNEANLSLANLGTKDHSSLNQLTWSTAGHTLDTNLVPTAATYALGSTTTNWGNLYLNRTAGSVLFMGASGLVTEDNAELFWDNTNDRLGIGTAVPGQNLSVIGNARVGDASTNYTNLGTDGSLTQAGTARKYKSIHICSNTSATIDGTYNGLTCTTSVAGTINDRQYLRVFDNGQRDSVLFYVAFPTDYVAGSDVKVMVPWITPGTTGNSAWYVGIVATGDGESLSTTMGVFSAQAVSTAPAVAYNRASFEATITGTGFAPGDNVVVVLFRNGTDAADTLASDTYVPGVCLKYLSDKRGSDS